MHAGILLLGLVLAGGSAEAAACFSPTDYQGWRARNAKTVYIRAGGDVFRLDLVRECPALLWPDPKLIIRTHGSAICSAPDVDLRVGDSTGGAAIPCMVKAMTGLSPAEVQGMPPKLRP